LYLIGTRDSKTSKKNSSYVIYEVVKCQENIRAKVKEDESCVDTAEKECKMVDEMTCSGGTCRPVHPKCAEMSAINEWISNKTI